MVLRPVLDQEPVAGEVIPVWNAVECRQKLSAREWLLITQPDHAALSGDIASQFATSGFPAADPEIGRAIAMHDSGWSLFESDPHACPRTHPDGRPLSFFEIEPNDFLRAWTASIDRVAEDSARGAYMVSQHFTWLGDFRLRRADDPAPVRQQITDFLRSEGERQRTLQASQTNTSRWDSLLPLLQFCDILSLYLCSGTRQPVEFPQEFAAGKVRAGYDGNTCILSPTPFISPMTVTFRARRYSNQKVATDFISVAVQLR
jgi:Protein of unknown function (DUF3891)